MSLRNTSQTVALKIQTNSLVFFFLKQHAQMHISIHMTIAANNKPPTVAPIIIMSKLVAIIRLHYDVILISTNLKVRMMWLV